MGDGAVARRGVSGGLELGDGFAQLLDLGGVLVVLVLGGLEGRAGLVEPLGERAATGAALLLLELGVAGLEVGDPLLELGERARGALRGRVVLGLELVERLGERGERRALGLRLFPQLVAFLGECVERRAVRRQVAFDPFELDDSARELLVRVERLA